jgi:hypothetical protein
MHTGNVSTLTIKGQVLQPGQSCLILQYAATVKPQHRQDQARIRNRSSEGMGMLGRIDLPSHSWLFSEVLRLAKSGAVIQLDLPISVKRAPDMIVSE